MARSGIAAAQMLCRLGAEVTINDIKTAEALGKDVVELFKLGIHNGLATDPVQLLPGMELMVISPGIAYAKPFVQKALEMGIEVIGELELGARLTRGDLMAITGTNGKTTTTTLVGEIMKAAGRRTYVVGNIGIPITAEADKTTDDDVTVAEVSSYQCESIVDFHPHVAACLNITEDHIVRHGSMEVYIAMKHRIFEKQTEQDVAVFNADDAVCASMAENVKAKIYWFSRKQQVKQGACVKDGKIVLHTDREQVVCRTDEVRIPGPHNLENALAAVAMTGGMGVTVSVMREVLQSFAGVEHRIETVRELDGVTYINDSKGTNVDSTQKAIATMTRPTVLILGGSDKKVSFAPLADSIVESGKIVHCVLIGDTAEQIRNALEAADYHAYTMAGYDFDHCLSLCRRLAPVGGCVLLSPACASFDMFRDFEHRGEVFKEKVNQMV